MAMGRPQLYTEDVPNEVVRYIAACKKNHYLPTIEGLAVHLKVRRQTLYNWANEHDDFFDILEALKAAQASQLIQNGLKGEYNSTITKLMLTKHDYVERQDVTSDNKAIAPVLVRFLDAEDNSNSK